MSKINGYYENVRGLRGKIKQGLKNKFTLAYYDLIAITETWLNDNFHSNEIFDSTFNVSRADRSVEKHNVLRANRPDLPLDTNVMGGGCLISLKNNISAIRLNAWEDECLFETVWLRINTSNNS